MLSKMTLIGLHNYSHGAIWGNIENYLPEGVNKEVLVNEILRQNGEFSVLYPDANFLTIQIQMFFMKYQEMFAKWFNVLSEEYDPLFNVDVKTDFTEHGVNDEESASSGVAASSSSSQGTGNSSGQNTTNENKSKAAYDASTLQPTEGNSSSGSTSLSSSESASESSSSNNSESMTASQEHTITRNDWKRGNYGTTMSQELLLAEYNARRFNIYNQIADLFAGEFCVTFYV